MKAASHLLCAVALASCAAARAELVGSVAGVQDGDTLTLLDDRRGSHKVRLAGIDAPEKNQAFEQR